MHLTLNRQACVFRPMTAALPLTNSAAPRALSAKYTVKLCEEAPKTLAQKARNVSIADMPAILIQLRIGYRLVCKTWRMLASFINGNGASPANDDWISTAARAIARKKLPVTLNGEYATFTLPDSASFTLRLGRGSIGAANEIFIQKNYDALCVRGNVVVDIGVNNGDSAISFVRLGASHVVALEPYPATIKIAEENVKMNGMADKITLLNAGFSSSRETVLVDSSLQPFSNSCLMLSKNGIPVRIMRLSDIIDYLAIEKGINGTVKKVLKIDCEGGECALQSCSRETLREFDRILLEYHFGYRNIAKKLLHAGFSVELLGKPKYSRNFHFENHHCFVGLLLARRLDA